MATRGEWSIFQYQLPGSNGKNIISYYNHSLLILSLITRWLAILAFSSYRGIVWTHNHYAGLRSDTHIRCLWSLQGPLIIKINFIQCYARYYQYFTCRCCSLRLVYAKWPPHVNRRRAPGVIRLNGYVLTQHRQPI